jgi:hypothetical protein
MQSPTHGEGTSLAHVIIIMKWKNTLMGPKRIDWEKKKTKEISKQSFILDCLA